MRFCIFQDVSLILPSCFCQIYEIPCLSEVQCSFHMKLEKHSVVNNLSKYVFPREKLKEGATLIDGHYEFPLHIPNGSETACTNLLSQNIRT